MSRFTSFDDIASFISDENAKLSANFTRIMEDFSLKIKNINEHFNSKVESLTLENEVLKTRVHSLEDHVARQNRKNQLVIRGIPFLKGEDLHRSLSVISSTIKFDIDKCLGVNIFRTINKNAQSMDVGSKRTLRSTSTKSQIKSVSPPVVVLNFVTSWDRNAFFRQYLLYLKNGNLTVSQLGIGLSSSSRIYINENLTKKNAIILTKCAALKSGNGIYQYFTKNGLVYVRRNKDDVPVPIHDFELLSQHSQLVPENALASTS